MTISELFFKTYATKKENRRKKIGSWAEQSVG